MPLTLAQRNGKLLPHAKVRGCVRFNCFVDKQVYVLYINHINNDTKSNIKLGGWDKG